MIRVSSNLTLIFKIFLPTFWLSFVMPLCLIYIYTIRYSGWSIRSWISIFILIVGFLIYWLLFRKLKRVDIDDEYMYISNYFKTVRLRWKGISKIRENKGIVFHRYSIKLRNPGRFGDEIEFIESGNSFRNFVRESPQKLHHLLRVENEDI